MTTLEIRPASDEEIADMEPAVTLYSWDEERCSSCGAPFPKGQGSHHANCDTVMWPRLKARIEADRARIAELEAQNIELAAEVAACDGHAYLRDTIAKQAETLKSIVANACCDRCQEAALVARAALNPEPASR